MYSTDRYVDNLNSALQVPARHPSTGESVGKVTNVVWYQGLVLKGTFGTISNASLGSLSGQSLARTWAEDHIPKSQNPSFSRSWESILPTSLASVFYRAEAGSLGHVLLLWIGPGVWIRFSFGFSRTVESASDT